MKKFFLLVLAFAVLLSCKKEPDTGIFELLESETTGIDFRNAIYNTETFNIFNYRNFYNGGGVAAGDINNDGLPDLLFTANMGSNKLYLNKGNFQFEDITEKAGISEADKWSTGVVMADINADGLLDIYVCNAGYQKGVSTENALFINNGDLTFTNRAAEYGLNEDGYTTHAAFFDYDKDGDLDVYILNNSFIPVNSLNYANNRELRAPDWQVKDYLKGGGDKLLKNENGKYIDVSEEAGIYGSLIGFGLGVTVGDINNDNWPDIYISNDFFEKDYLYINQQNGTFREELEERIGHTSLASMGADMADINQDGRPEIFVTDMLPATERRLKTTASFENHYIYSLKQERGFYHQFMQNTLQLNNGDGIFSEIAYFSGVAKSDWSWGALMFDADNDGLTDIYISNGILHDVIDQDFIDFFAHELSQKMALTGKKESIDKILEKMPSTPIVNSFFHNKGQLKFSEEGEKFGFTKPGFSNGAVYVDLDNDGDLDLVTNNINDEASVYRNRTNLDKSRHYLKIKLKGEGKNPGAIGSQVFIYQKDKVFAQQLIPSRGYQSGTDYVLTFGLGESTAVDSIKIIWPNDRMTFETPAGVDQLLVFDIKDTKQIWKPLRKQENRLLKEVIHSFEPHRENNYQDYYLEKNMPFKLSAEGPKAAIGDLNGDGVEDIIIAGAKGELTRTYFGMKNGTFREQVQEEFKKTALLEDTALELFDADGDGDLDLYIGTGGNEYPKGAAELADFLFLNNGKGVFTASKNAMPSSGFNTSVVKSADINGDGKPDLFVGLRSIPQQYGEIPPSFILINTGEGRFTDQTLAMAPELSVTGMVTDARWTDIDKDGKPELVVIGDWMHPKIFKNSSGKLKSVQNTGLENQKGFWSALEIADLDNDGDLDLIFGNMGENFAYNIDSTHPFSLWINDFDKNGTRDKVFSKTVDGRNMPVFLKRDITEQFPTLKTSNLKHAEYAERSIEDLFDKSLLKPAFLQEINTLKSIVAINDGSGQFTIQELPKEVQLSSVNAIASVDLNKDGLPDLVFGGNTSQMIPQFGRLDACLGKILLNKGGNQFDVKTGSAGLNIRGEIREIRLFSLNRILVLLNNEKPRMYSY
jgi:hypothetical protein